MLHVNLVTIVGVVACLVILLLASACVSPPEGAAPVAVSGYGYRQSAPNIPVPDPDILCPAVRHVIERMAEAGATDRQIAWYLMAGLYLDTPGELKQALQPCRPPAPAA